MEKRFLTPLIADDVRSVLVVGAKGMLGTDVTEAVGSSQCTGRSDFDVTAVDIEQIDITDAASVQSCMESCRPDIVVNCAAYTDVDGCETNSQTAFAVNAAGPMNLAVACKAAGCKLVHISTDFVFDGERRGAYLPTDEPNPLSVYGESKLAGEQNVQRNLDDHLIVRTSWLYGSHGKNFVTTIAKAARQREYLEVVDDQVGSPTYTVDLAAAILALIGAAARGMYHFHNRGHCSWYEFARQIVRLCRIDVEVRPISTAKLGRPARRPSWSVLDMGCFERATGKPVRTWQGALAEFISRNCTETKV